MSLKLFVTGTDTGIGKTYISVGLLRAFTLSGYSAIGIKPIASGGFREKNNLYNQDALDLNRASSIQLNYQHTNPFVFEPPIAPHIAALQAGVVLSLKDVISKSDYALQYPCDVHLTEGVGGWSIPLNENETMIDFVAHYQMNIILVVGMRLGCINHAMLTYQAIKKTGLFIAGWVANCFEINELEPKDVILTLKHWLDIPYLGMVPYGKKPENFLNVDELFHNCRITR